MGILDWLDAQGSAECRVAYDEIVSLRQQLAEAQAREQELNTDQWWYKELENAANSFDVSIDFRRAVFGVLYSYMDRAHDQSRDALESAIAAAVKPYKRDAELWRNHCEQQSGSSSAAIASQKP